MTEASSPDPPDIDRVRPGATSKAHGFSRRSPRNVDDASILPLSNPRHTENIQTLPLSGIATSTDGPQLQADGRGVNRSDSSSNPAASNEKPPDPSRNVASNTGSIEPVPSQEGEAQGLDLDSPGDETKKKANILVRFCKTTKVVLMHSWINVLLIFVPIGIIVEQVPGIHAGVVFAVNCIAIVPLAGLLSHATESVARKLGDTVGALLNVTFGNAVELIIFIIALAKNEIRIVQASLLGSILANLLLILGMCFFLGGLRFREQIYNSTVTQMSACLLSLSVISLVLPTAFHASFKDHHEADLQSLKISRGTSVILLLVYVVYLLFQLKSHAYMYESTPQHIVDAESTPGPAAAWLDSSSSEDSSSSSSDSDDSSRSRDTVRKRMRKVLRAGRRRKSSVASTEDNGVSFTRTPSFGTTNITPQDETVSEESSGRPLPRRKTTSVGEGSDGADGGDRLRHPRGQRRHKRRKHKKHNPKSRNAQDTVEDTQGFTAEDAEEVNGVNGSEPRRVDFAVQGSANDAVETTSGLHTSARRPFPVLRGMSVKNLAPAVFVQKPEIDATPPATTGPIPRVRYGIRRTNSLPDRLHQYQFRPPGAMLPSQIPLMALTGGNAAEPADHREEDDNLSRTSAIILLLISTGLVALCAEFVVGSIEEVVKSGPVKEVFIGLIILPIVGNAAEHVTAITVAMKNKMDLAIGVAVGSSIQIALFITPLIVILGWIMDREMSLYFTLFETVCLFVSAFIVNFLVLDGRSNYLEGALLCCTYTIIAVAAYFYPHEEDASVWGQ